MIIIWEANYDFQLILDPGKVIQCMAKYVTKPEATHSRGISTMMKKVFEKNIEEGLNAQSSLKRSMSKLIGDRMLSKQETCHLIMGLPLVSCSLNFIRINLLNDSSLIEMDEFYDDNALPTTISIIDAYSERLDKNIWLNEELYDMHLSNLKEMALRRFTALFYIGKRGNRKNKICEHLKDNTVAVFYPRYSSNKKSPNYAKYCKFALIKYNPWEKDIENAWKTDDNSDELIKNKWEDFAKSWIERGNQVPDYLQKEFDLAQNSTFNCENDSNDINELNEDTNSIDTCDNSWIDAAEGLV